MNKIIIIFIIVICNFCFLSANTLTDSVIKTKKYFIHQEIVCPILYQLNAQTTNKSISVNSWQYFTGGLKYKIFKSAFLGINYLYYTRKSFSKNQEASISIDDFQNSIAFNDIYYFAKNHTYKQFYLWPSYYQKIKNFYFDIGVGGGYKKYINDNPNLYVKEVNKNWCNSIDVGYNIKIYKNLSLNTNIGILNLFSFAKSVNYSSSNYYSTKSISEYVQSNSNDLKTIRVSDNSINCTYKNIGLYQYSFLLKGGISLQYNF